MTGSKLPSGIAFKTLAIVFFVIVTLILLGGGYWVYQVQAKAIHQSSYETIAAIAKMKVGQIAQWRKERLMDIAREASSSGYIDPFTKIAAHTETPAVMDRMRHAMARARNGEMYSHTIVLSSSGQVLLSTGDDSAPLDAATQRAVTAALAAPGGVISDFFRAPDGKVYIDIVEGVRDANGNVLGFIVLRCRAADYLYPLIQSWPTPSRSAETLLVERQGEEVVFLNELRYRSQTALSLRESLSQTGLPAVQAVLGKRGMLDGKDYRGVEVLADLRPIPNTPWFMVAKVDQDEILAELSYRAASIGVIVGALILLAAAATAFVYKRRQAGLYRQLLESKSQRQETQEQFRATLYSIGDGVLTVNTQACITGMNPVAERLTGWTEAEACGKPLDEVFVILNQETRTPVANPVATVLRDGVVVGLANHTVLIARDGTEHAIADSAAPIRNEQGVVNGVVLVFSDVTEQYHMREVLRRSEREYRLLFEGMMEGFALHEIVCDASGKPVDYRFLSMNPAFERMTGLRAADVVGRTVREVIPAIEPGWIERYGRVALTGEPIHFEEHSGALSQHFKVTAFRPQPNQFATVFDDITERKAAEARIARLTQLYAALSECNQAIVHCTSVEELLPKICQVVVQFGGIKMAWIGMVDEATQRVNPVASFGVGTEYLEGLEISTNADEPSGRGPTGTSIRENQSIWSQDFLNDPSTTPWHERGVRYGWKAATALPLCLRGKAIGAFVIYSDKVQAFDEEARKLLVEMAYDISFAFDNFAHEKERKQAQEALSRSEQRLRFALETVDIGAWEIELRDHTSHRDLIHDRIFGYETLLPNWTYEMFLEHVLPEDRPDVNRKFREATATQSDWNFECRIRRVDGEIRWIWAAGGHEQNLNGEPKRLAGIVQDITERKQVEEALLKSEALYRSLFKNMMNGFAYCQMVFEEEKAVDFLYLAVNDSFASHTGLKNVVGKKVSEVIPGIRETDQSLLDTYGRVALTGKPEHFETFVEALQMWFSISVYSPARGYFGAVFDVITERKQAEEALFRSEERFRNVFQQLPSVAIQGYGPDGTTQFWNQASERLYGYTAAEAIGRNLLDLIIPPEMRNDVAQAIQWMNETGQSIPAGELSLMRKDGSRVAVFSSHVLVKIPRHPAELFCVDIDLTEHNQVSEALRQNRNMLSYILNSVPQGVFWKDRNSVYQGCNEVFARDVGLASTKDVIGKTDFDFPWSKEEAEHYVADDREVMETNQPKRHFLERERLADGTCFIVETNKVPLTDINGQVNGILGIYEDVTVRMQAEETLRESEQLLREAQMMADMGSYILDISAGSWTSSDGLNMVFGIGNDYERSVKGWIDLIHPDDRSMMDDYLRNEVLGKGRTFNKEYRIIRQDDHEVRWVIGIGKLNFDTQGQPLKMQGTIQDITERKQAEEMLRESEERYRTILNASPDAIFISDIKDGRFLMVSPGAVEMVGCNREEDLLGALLTDFIVPEDRERAASNIARLVQGEVIGPIEYRALRKDGSAFEMEANAELIRNTEGQPIQMVAIVRDITERHQAEEAMQASLSLLNATLESTPSGILVVDQNRRIMLWNQRFIKMWNIPEEIMSTRADEVALNSVLDQITQPAEFLAKLDDLYTHPEKTSMDEFVLVDGRIISRYSQPQKFGDTIVGRVWSFQDITKRKQAEKALHETERRHHAILRSAMDGYWEVDMEGRILDVNDTYSQMIGYSVQELLTMRVCDLEVNESPDQIVEHMQKIMALGEHRFETQHRRKDGSIIDIESSVQYRRDEKKMVAFIHDITSRKQAEDAMRLQSSALGAAANAIIITDREGVIEWVNPAFTLFTGYSIEEAVGKTPTLLKSDKQDQAFYKALWDTVLAGKVWHGELINRRKDGSLYSEEMTITPIKDAQGEITHFIAVKQDITERRRIEEKLQQTERMESIGRLASGVAHDLNNILTPIILSTDLLRTAEEASTRERLISSIEECAQRGASVVNQVLTFARGVKGARTTLQLNRLVNDMERIMNETFPKSIIIASAIYPDLWSVSGDSTQIHQVLLNLCINARDAMPDGGTLLVSTANEAIDENFAAMVPDAKAGDYAMVSISDSGTGIPEEIINKIFDPFFTTKEIGKGTGLGLSTAIGIIRNHGGFVTVESVEGHGSTFKVFLPVEKKTETEQKRSVNFDMPQGEGETILVVEDEEFIAKATALVLERNGYKALTATNGNEALTVFGEHAKEIKIVLTDVMMPEMDGVQFSRALKGIKPQVKIIASTGHASDAQQAELRELGVQVILRKPYDAKTLLIALHDAIHKSARKK